MGMEWTAARIICQKKRKLSTEVLTVFVTARINVRLLAPSSKKESKLREIWDET